MTQPTLIIHGGAGSAIADGERKDAVREALHEVRDSLYTMLGQGATAREVVCEGCRRLEDDPNFNAGTGSVLQSDGQIRLSAALMDGVDGSFSGVINAQRLRNPIDLAAFLQGEKDRVVAGDGAADLMRELQTPRWDPTTEKRLGEWMKQRREDFEADMATVVSEEDESEAADETEAGFEPGHGTIGVVARDTQGRLAAGTSTGGRGFERIGRVSDSAMPAGNYASGEAAVSATGVGEDIIDECVAARIAVRVTDGASLREALERSFAEASARGRSFGVIAVDADGGLGWAKTTDILLAAWHDGEDSGDTLDLEVGTVVGGPHRD